MNEKEKRHTALRHILSSQSGSTQTEIKSSLERQGIIVSQSTLSRDLREVSAVKIPLEGGGSAYRLGSPDENGFGLADFGRVMSEFAVGYESIGNFIIIKTKPGNARDLCLVLDRKNWKEIAGTIAGDDTILVITRSGSDCFSVMAKLKEMRGEIK